MSFLKKALLSLVLICAVSTARGQSVCNAIANYKEILECAESRAPRVINAENSLKEKSSQIDIATQFLNPELSLQSVSENFGSTNNSETDVSLLFPIEWGGRRSSRKSVASAEEMKARYELTFAKAQTRREVLLKLFRLKQINEELSVIDESISTFSKLVKQYESRPARSPEQEVSLTVFKMAKDEYGLKKIGFSEELGVLNSYFEVAVGMSVDQINKVSMASFVWPQAGHSVNLENSPLLTPSILDIESAKAVLSQEEAHAYPILSVGPSAKFIKDSGRDLQQWGLSISAPLPVFNLNGAGRRAAQVSVEAAEKKRQLILHQLELERKRLGDLYSKEVAALSVSPTTEVLDQRHKKVETLFLKGLVPSSLVIEAHRSIFELQKTRNEHQIKALETLLSLEFMDGKVLGTSL
ncbi:MAG TPA: TolC family protein [Bdellovibrio sp.]|uniref:TolC family protein n=1 Tax=Bdellovibrio sp. TaxID=28201 RepID=UPI002F220E37